MTLFPLGRASAIGVAILYLAGCGGSSSTATIPQRSSAVRETAQHGKSWMLPGTSGGKLLYATGGCNGTCVLSYPNLRLVGALSTIGNGACSDGQGNVFLTDGDEVVEYAHGGTSPVAILNIPGGENARGCSVDPGSNDLAVTFTGSDSDLAIFANEQGTPKQYTTHIGAMYCGYDNNGNLLIDGRNDQKPAFAELPKGSNDFTVFSIPESVGAPGQVQWDGKYITYESYDLTRQIFQLSVSGSEAEIVSSTKFKSMPKRSYPSWIYGSNVVVPYNIRGIRANVIGVWKYPNGGRPVNTIRNFPPYKKRTIDFAGVTVSVAVASPFTSHETKKGIETEPMTTYFSQPGIINAIDPLVSVGGIPQNGRRPDIRGRLH